jgi:tRNA(Ile)-lysidine synthase
MPLAARVLAALSQDALLRPGDRVLVALSGGSDSVALFMLLRELAAAGACEIAGAAHLNHGLREHAGEDEAFCRALAETAGVAFRSECVDVGTLARERGLSIEDAGRQARYAFFERAAGELGADLVATGHTRDDQAETFLLRLIRGAGPRGLGGIHPKVSLPAEAPAARRSGRHTIRPLLDIGRDELREYLGSIGQSFREDDSNRDVSIPRNRVRHELLPFLRERFSPAIVETLAREAAIARHDEARLQAEAIDLARLIVLTSGESVEVEADALRSLPKALAVRVARLALQHLAPDRFVGFDHIDRLLESVDGESLSLPGQHAEHRGGRIRLSRTPFRPFSNSFRVSLSIPGEAVLLAHGWAVAASMGPEGTLSRRSAKREGGHSGGGGSDYEPEAWVDPARVTLPLSVRSRRPGDRVRPLGMGGRAKKLQDVLVDRKIAREERDALPLVVDETDRIVWIVGEAVAEDFRVTEASQGVIFLKARRLGGQG